MSEIEILEEQLQNLRQIPSPKQQASALEQIIARLFSETTEFRESLKPEIHVRPAAVSVMPLPAAEVTVNLPEQAAPIVNVRAAPAPVVNVDLGSVVEALHALADAILVSSQQPAMVIDFTRNQNGLIKSATVEEA